MSVQLSSSLLTPGSPLGGQASRLIRQQQIKAAPENPPVIIKVGPGSIASPRGTELPPRAAPEMSATGAPTGKGRAGALLNLQA